MKQVLQFIPYVLGIGLFLFFVLPLKTPEPQETQNEPEEVILEPVEPYSPPTADQLYLVINQIRRDNNLPALARSTELNASAMHKCEDMVENDYYAHENPVTGVQGIGLIPDSISAGSVVYKSENINMHPRATASGFVDSWMNSDSHRAAILDPQYSHTGFAVCGDDMNYAVNHKVSLREHQQPAPAQQAPQTQQSYPMYRYEQPPSNRQTCYSSQSYTRTVTTECY